MSIQRIFINENMKNSAKHLHSDRFIPFRSVSAPKNSLLSPMVPSPNNGQQKPTTKSTTKKKQLTFSKLPGVPSQTAREFLTTMPTSLTSTSTTPTLNPSQPLTSYKIIDVPGVIDNFYYNTIDISTADFVAVALKDDLYMFRETDNMVVQFKERKNDALVSCVKFANGDDVLVAGDQDGVIEVNDVVKERPIRFWKKHALRVGRLEDSKSQPFLFYSGSKDYSINLNDLRLKNPVVSVFKSQKSQICGLSLKENLLASGSNDGTIALWDIRNKSLVSTLTHHKGAVKALTWCPWRSSILVSGGGKKDKQIVIYDTKQHLIERTIPTTDQLSDICWRPSTQQLIYGYGPQGKVKIDNSFNPKLQTRKLTKHLGRIVGLRVNKNRDSLLCSLCADQSIKYWDLDSGQGRMQAGEMLERVGVLGG